MTTSSRMMPAAGVMKSTMKKPINDGRHHQANNWSRSSRSTSEKHALIIVTSILDRFRRATKIIMLLMRGFRQTKIYFKDEDSELRLQKRLRSILKETNDDEDDDEEEEGGGGGRSHDVASSSTKCMIGHQLYLCLTTIPHHRNDATIRQILWFLKAMKAFQNLFPVEMEQEVAKYVEYARFDEGRVIASQGRRPECLYFIISGRVKLVRQFRLLNGVVTKFMGYIGKGKTTNPDELSGQWLREDTLVARGQVEMLLLNKEVFAHLQHTTDVSPLDFIRSLPYFQRFPVENFLNNPDAIEYKYYGDGKIVVEDSNRTASIYIIKSGFVRVVRCQLVKCSGTLKDRSRWTKEKGMTAETFTHRSCRRRTNKKAVIVKFDINEIQLPKVSEVRLLRELNEPLKKRRQHTNPSNVSLAEHWKSQNIETEIRRHKGNSKRRSERLSRKFETIEEESLSTNDGREEVSPKDILPISSRETAPEDICLFPVLSRKDKEEKQRLTFLQLDTLTAGDIFGLDHLHPAVASEPKGVSLVSGGAEVIQINKRFYMNDFGNNGLHATDSVCKEYISEKMAEEDLLKQEAWRRYKTSVYRKATADCGSHTSTSMTHSSSGGGRRCINR